MRNFLLGVLLGSVLASGAFVFKEYVAAQNARLTRIEQFIQLMIR